MLGGGKFALSIGLGLVSTLFVLDVSTFAGVQSAATPERYSTYHNALYGFSIQYPAAWKRDPTGTGVFGITLYSLSNVKGFNNGLSGQGDPYLKAKDIVFDAFGAANADLGASVSENFKQMVADFQTHIAPLHKHDVYYRWGVRGNYIWVNDISRIGHNALDHHEFYFSLMTVQEFDLYYPANQAAKYEPMFKHIATSFTPGNSPG